MDRSLQIEVRASDLVLRFEQIRRLIGPSHKSDGEVDLKFVVAFEKLLFIDIEWLRNRCSQIRNGIGQVTAGKACGRPPHSRLLVTHNL